MPDTIIGDASEADANSHSRNPKLRRWQARVDAADRAYRLWADKFMVESLEDYYCGLQWKETVPRSHYTINLCYPTVETKIPSMLFFQPKLHVMPRPARASDPGSHLDEKAQLLEETAQTFMTRKDTGVMVSANLALRESFYGFGVVQVVYNLDFTDNPNAGRPVLKEGVELKDSSGETVKQGPIIAKEDQLYLKWIPSNTFRMGSTNIHPVTEFNDWFGYFEWQYKEDVLANKSYRNRAQVRSNGSISTQYFNPGSDDEDDKKRREMVKVWKIWDMRAKVRHVFPDGGDRFFVEDQPWDRTPSGKPFHGFSFLRRHTLLSSWYPLPPMFNWISPQDELNETRDMQKVHRKRAYRRNLVQKGAVDPAEMRKLESGGDMVWAEVSRLDAIKPMEDAPLDRAVTLNVPTTKEDFMNTSGIGGDRRGVAEAETATQASIIDTNAKIRDSYERQQVGEFMADIAYNLLQTIRAKFTLPLMVMTNVDPQAEFAPYEAVRVAGLWQEITAPGLGSFDFDVSTSVESLSPVTEDLMRAQWNNVLGILSNPTVLIALLSSPTLLRKTLGLYGIRTDKEVGEITTAMQAVLAALAGQQQAGAKPASGSSSGSSSLEGSLTQMAGQGVGPAPTLQ